MHPLRTALPLSLALVGLVVPAAFTWSQGEELDTSIISEPCGALPATYTCLQAAIKEPTPNQEFVIVNGSTPIAFRGVAERESRTYLYILRRSGALVTPEPLMGAAETDGTFTFSIVANQLGEGSYRALAFYAASLKDGREDNSFFQVTGNPEIAFRLSPAVPSEGTCDDDCSKFGVEANIPGVETGGRILYYDEPRNNYYWLSEAFDASATTTAQQAVRDAAVAALANKVCIEGLFTAPSILTALNLTPTTLGQNNTSVTFDELLDTVTAAAADLGGNCGEPTEFLEGVPDWLMVFRNTRPGSRLRCSVEDICYHVELVTGSDPLLFFSSDADVATTIRLLPVNGTVTATFPPMQDGAWTHVVSPVASTAPLAYHVALRAHPPVDTGWILPRTELESSLRSLLLAQGFPTAEVDAFIRVEVAPQLTDRPLIAVQPITQDVMAAALPLSIAPAPAHLTRIAFVLTPVQPGSTLHAPDPASLPRFDAGAGLRVREYAAFVRF